MSMEMRRYKTICGTGRTVHDCYAIFHTDGIFFIMQMSCGLHPLEHLNAEQVEAELEGACC